MTKPSASRFAFTMLEMLVVVSIMAVLASMILVVAGILMGDAKKKKTNVIIQTVQTGIQLAIANKGSAISPTEHPFAGSRANRFDFIRTNSKFAGVKVSGTGTALRGVPDPTYLGADQTKLLMSDDRYADNRVVLLYGAKREDIGVLQSLRKVVTSYRLLPMPPRSAAVQQVIDPKTGAAASSYTDTNFPDTMIPSLSVPSKPTDQETDPTYGKLADSKPALDYLFGNSSAQSELASLKALFNADPTLPEDVNDYRVPVEDRNVGGVHEGLVYTNAGTAKGNNSAKYENKWKPGYIPVSGGNSSTSVSSRTLDATTGTTWVRYRLAGLAVYDAWDNELMTVTGSNNSYRVLSAGADGALAVDPGSNNQIETQIEVDAEGKLKINAKDKDGAKDNLQ